MDDALTEAYIGRRQPSAKGASAVGKPRGEGAEHYHQGSMRGQPDIQFSAVSSATHHGSRAMLQETQGFHTPYLSELMALLSSIVILSVLDQIPGNDNPIVAGTSRRSIAAV